MKASSHASLHNGPRPKPMECFSEGLSQGTDASVKMFNIPNKSNQTHLGSMTEPELTSTGDPETVLQKLYIDLCNLIVESRLPGINERGYGEGIHCPPLMGPNTHSCDLSVIECQKHQKLIHRLLRATKINVVEIEVLMLPDCCKETKPNERILCKEYVLLERWSVNCIYGKIQSIMDVTQLLRAVRSFLYFSQISAWLSASGGKTPSSIYYWVKSPTELPAARFESEPETHTFPVCRIFEGLFGKVEVKYRPRSQYIPIIPCSKHPPCENSYISLTSDSNSCQNISMNDNVKYLQKNCGTNEESIDHEENSLSNSSLCISPSISCVTSKTLCMEASATKPKGILKDTNSQTYLANILDTTSNLSQDVDKAKNIKSISKSQPSDTCIDIYSNNASQEDMSLETNDETLYQKVYYKKLSEKASDSVNIDINSASECSMHFSEGNQNNSKLFTDVSSINIFGESSEIGSVSLPTSLSKKARSGCRTSSPKFFSKIESLHYKSNIAIDVTSQRHESCRSLNLLNCSRNSNTVPNLPRKAPKHSKLQLQRNSTPQDTSYSKFQNVPRCAINQNKLESSSLDINKLFCMKNNSNTVTRKNLLNVQSEGISEVSNDVCVVKSSNNLRLQSSQVSSVPKKRDVAASLDNVCRKRKISDSTSENRSISGFQEHASTETSTVATFFINPKANSPEHSSKKSTVETERYFKKSLSKCDNTKSARVILPKRKKSKKRGHKSSNSISKMLDQTNADEKCDIFGGKTYKSSCEVVQTLNISETGFVKSPNFLHEIGTTAVDNILQHHVESSLAISKSKAISFTHSLPVPQKEWHSTSICCEAKTLSLAYISHLHGKVCKGELSPVVPKSLNLHLPKSHSSKKALLSEDTGCKLSENECNYVQNVSDNIVKPKEMSNFSQTLRIGAKAISAQKVKISFQSRKKSIRLYSYLSKFSSNIPNIVAETRLLSRNVDIPGNKGINLKKIRQMLRTLKRKTANKMKSFPLLSQGNTVLKFKDTLTQGANRKMSSTVLSRTKSISEGCSVESNLSRNFTVCQEKIDSSSVVSAYNVEHSNRALKRKIEATLNAVNNLPDDFPCETQNPFKRILRDVKNTAGNISRIGEASHLIQSQSSSTLQEFLHASPSSILCHEWNENFDRFPNHLSKFSKGKKLLGNFEESILKGCLQPVSTVEGFQAEIGASGSFCPDHLTLPADVYFYELGSPHQGATPYMAHVVLGETEYYLPKKGAMQVTLFNPTETVVKMFVLNYDLSSMPPMCHTFIRQKTYYMPVGATEKDPSSQKWLRYIIHLRFASSKSGKIFLHKDFKIVVLNKSNDDAASDHIQEPRELRSFLSVPKNPMFSNF